MNEEFAIEPTAFTSFEDVRYVLGKFGLHEARFISSIPSTWVPQVYAQLDALPDGPAKLRAREEIRRMVQDRCGIVSGGVTFNPANTWLNNAIDCGRSFEGILVSNETAAINGGDECRSMSEVDNTFFGNTSETIIKATVEGFSNIATRLIQVSHEVFLIDPYMFTNAYKRSSSIDVLKDFIRIGTQGKCKKFVIYTAYDPGPNHLATLLEKHFAGCGASIRVYQVADNQPVRLHARYLLSKRGGIRLDRGFQPDGRDAEVTAIGIGNHEALCRQYLDCDHEFNILNDIFYQG